MPMYSCVNFAFLLSQVSIFPGAEPPSPLWMNATCVNTQQYRNSLPYNADQQKRCKGASRKWWGLGRSWEGSVGFLGEANLGQSGNGSMNFSLSPSRLLLPEPAGEFCFFVPSTHLHPAFAAAPRAGAWPEPLFLLQVSHCLLRQGRSPSP